MIPNIKFVELMILGGFELYRINKLCSKWHLPCISDSEFKKLTDDLSENQIFDKQIQLNSNNIQNRKHLELNKEVKEKLKYSDLSEKFLQGLSRYILFNDFQDVQVPEEISNILFNYKLRKFIELGRIVGMTFPELNRAWLIFNPIGILHESYDVFCYFFWDVSKINKKNFEKKVTECKILDYYNSHVTILEKDKNFFLALYGLEDKNFFIELMQNLYFRINNSYRKKYHLQEDYSKLQTLLTNLLNNLAKAPEQIRSSSFFSDPQPKINQAAKVIWEKNHAYYFKNKYGIDIND